MERLVAEKAEAISGYDMDRLIRVDTLFHDAIYKASRNQRLTNIINNLR